MPSRKHYGDAFQLRADLWRVPFAMCLGAAGLFAVTAWVDGQAARGALTLPGWISVGGLDDARAILGAMLGAVSTVLALIFSVALLVLSMAVSNFGPRILHRFVRDAITQLTIGLFLASFVHTLLTFVATRGDGSTRFVPQLTIMSDVVLVMLSFAFLVVFSHRIAVSIQTQNVVAHIVADLDAALAELGTLFRQLGPRAQTPGSATERDARVRRCRDEGQAVRATRTGFVQEVDLLHLLAASRGSEALVNLLYRPGQFVLEGAVVAEVWPAAMTAVLEPAILRDVKIGAQRTLKQDVEFGIAQLVEIALRAMGQAINDSFTGLTCVDWLGDELRVLASLGERMEVGEVASGPFRLMWPPLRIERLVKAAFDQIRQAAARDPAVSIRLLQTFARLAREVDNARFRDALSQQVEAIWEAAEAGTFVKSDRADIEAAYRGACGALGR